MGRRAAPPEDELALFTLADLEPPKPAGRRPKACSGCGATQDLITLGEGADQVTWCRKPCRPLWEARFERADWVAPYDTAGGLKKGDRVLGWRCPDPGCGQVEINTFGLSINHGWDPHVPGREPWDGKCQRLKLLANHAVYDARRAQIRQLAGEGLDDEQIAARIGFWDAKSIASYRKEDAKAARAKPKRQPEPEPPSAEPPAQTTLIGNCWECDYGGHICERCRRPVEHGRAWHLTCPQ